MSNVSIPDSQSGGDEDEASVARIDLYVDLAFEAWCVESSDSALQAVDPASDLGKAWAALNPSELTVASQNLLMRIMTYVNEQATAQSDQAEPLTPTIHDFEQVTLAEPTPAVAPDDSQAAGAASADEGLKK